MHSNKALPKALNSFNAPSSFAATQAAAPNRAWAHKPDANQTQTQPLQTQRACNNTAVALAAHAPQRNPASETNACQKNNATKKPQTPPTDTPCQSRQLAFTQDKTRQDKNEHQRTTNQAATCQTPPCHSLAPPPRQPLLLLLPIRQQASSQTRLRTQAALHIGQQSRRRYIQRIAQAKQHAHTRAIAPKFNQRNVIAVYISTQSQHILTPALAQTQPAQLQPKCLICFQNSVPQIGQNHIKASWKFLIYGAKYAFLEKQYTTQFVKATSAVIAGITQYANLGFFHPQSPPASRAQ